LPELLAVDSKNGHWTAPRAASNLPSAVEIEMSNSGVSEYQLQLLDKAKAALREKDTMLASALLTDFSEHSVLRDKARLANDPA